MMTEQQNLIRLGLKAEATIEEQGKCEIEILAVDEHNDAVVIDTIICTDVSSAINIINDASIDDIQINY